MSTQVKSIQVRKPTPQESRQLASCPTWSCEASTFDWFYSNTETCLITAGSATISFDGGEAEIAAGDYVVLPKGFSCVWSVKEPISKHYRFE